MALHLPIGPLKLALGWSWYRDANPIPTSPLADDLATAPLGPESQIRQLFCIQTSNVDQSEVSTFIVIATYKVHAF